MLTKWEELRLIARCVAGDDRRAFEQLVEEYNDGLRRFLLNLTLGDAALTDDLAQETFIKVYISLRSYQGIARFRTWLYRIAYNEFYMYVRRRRESGEDERGYGNVADTVSPYDADDASMDVERCLKVLSEAERTAVLLFYLDDRPIKEIADIMQMPQGTVKSHLSRAKAKMAKLF
ncbi:RNA polymerase sigma factor [Barnesiella sp. WM24]|uniref:RNA polymerase sigma factor n=1 Tax=Barnesiella sp. WM24 TaxID=2558278 RepID=UPI001FD7ECE2|nr:RNA polymerase sigma factor [Barnesiella sp. WM24]